MKNFFTLIAASVFILPLRAQQECGTVMPPSYQTIYNQRVAQVQANEIQGVIVVPVHIHLVRESNGNSALTLAQIQTELDSVNYYYENAGLIFIECIAAEMIDEDTMYNYESSFHQSELLTNHFTPNVLNLYFANTVSINQSGVCGYSWFPGGPDAAFVAASCAINGSTLAHEIGHYMGLMHTHGGSSDELVDGSNCSTEGDLICDTPADPGLSGLVDTACMYTGTALDANNQPYQPDVTNIMSYSRKVCRTSFSPTQYAVINATYWSDRTYLQCISTATNDDWMNVEARLFPNPAQDQVRILFNSPGVSTRIEIFNASGRLVKVDYSTGSELYHDVDVSGLADGAYTCKIISEDSDSMVEPFIIAR